jgi:hypothetical protein
MTRLFTLVTRFSCGLFILWVGGLAPLVYFDLFAVNHRIQPYRFALFEARPEARLSSSEIVEPQLRQRIVRHLAPQQDFLSPDSLFSGPVHLFQGSLGQLYLIAGTIGLLLLLFRRLNLAGQPAGVSAELPPPERPPRLSLTSV